MSKKRSSQKPIVEQKPSVTDQNQLVFDEKLVLGLSGIRPELLNLLVLSWVTHKVDPLPEIFFSKILSKSFLEGNLGELVQKGVSALQCRIKTSANAKDKLSKNLEKLLTAHANISADQAQKFLQEKSKTPHITPTESLILKLISDSMLPFLFEKGKSFAMNSFTYKDWYSACNSLGTANPSKVINTATLPLLILAINGNGPEFKKIVELHIKQYGLHDGAMILLDLTKIYQTQNLGSADPEGIIEECTSKYIKDFLEIKNPSAQQKLDYSPFFNIQSVVAHSWQSYQEEMHYALEFIKLNPKHLGRTDIRDDIIHMMIQNANITGDIRYLDQLNDLLKQVSGQRSQGSLSNLLDIYADLLEGSKAINDIFSDDINQEIAKNREDNLLLVKYFESFAGAWLIKGQQTPIEAHLMLDLFIKYAVCNDLLPQAQMLITYLVNNKDFQIRITESFAMLKDLGAIPDGLNDLIKHNLTGFEQKASININLYKLISSIYTDEINDGTFDAAQIVFNFIRMSVEKGYKVSSRLVEIFAASCKLLADHLLDSNYDDIATIESYLKVAKFYGAEVTTSDYFRVALRKREIKQLQESLELLKSQSVEDSDNYSPSESWWDNKKLSNVQATLESFVAANSSEQLVEKTLAQEIESSLIPLEQEEERSCDRKHHAGQLLKKAANVSLSQESSVISIAAETLSFNIGERIYESTDKISFQYKKKLYEKNAIFSIGENKYAVLSDKVVKALPDIVMARLCHSLENGLFRGHNKVIDTKNYYKIRIDADARVYATVEYRSKLDGKEVSFIILDKVGNHAEITRQTDKLKVIFLPDGAFCRIIGGDVLSSDSAFESSSPDYNVSGSDSDSNAELTVTGDTDDGVE